MMNNKKSKIICHLTDQLIRARWNLEEIRAKTKQSGFDYAAGQIKASIIIIDSLLSHDTYQTVRKT